MIVIDHWAGLVTNASPYSLTHSAAVTQVNLQILAPAQLTVRPGLNPVSFFGHSGATAAVRRAFWYPATAAVVYSTGDGSVRVATNPS
jgi:hypothetical protein